MRARAATLIFQCGRCVLSRLLLCNPLNARTAVSLERPRYFSPLSPQMREYVHVIFLGQRLSQDAGNIGSRVLHTVPGRPSPIEKCLDRVTVSNWGNVSLGSG